MRFEIEMFFYNNESLDYYIQNKHSIIIVINQLDLKFNLM